METLNNMKRKKRKTRRCLDELRKKQQTNGICKLYKNADAKIHKSKSNCIKNNYITSNRLTLFNKAVRSETVTRLQLSELERKKIKSNKDRETITSNFRTNAVSLTEQNNNKLVLETQNQDITEDNSEIEISSPILTNGKLVSEKETPKSVILFSPESQNGEVCTTNLDSTLETSSISSIPSTIPINYEANILVDIMKKIDIYVQQNFSHIVNYDDIIREEIAVLEKICSKSKYQPEKNLNNTSYNSQTTSQNVSSSSLYSSPEVLIIQDPKDYLGYSRTQLTESENNRILESSQSPLESTSNSSISIHMPSTSPVISAVYDTPEYSYYPHRLNN